MKNNTPQDLSIGTILESNNFGKFKIIDYKKYNDIIIEFIDTGYINSVSSDQIRNGRVRDAMIPNVYGVGFLGDGPHVAKLGLKHTKEYKVWHDMMMRCYSKECQDDHPSYKQCYVSNEWHNFQNFAEWYKKNIKDDGQRYEIDKDLLTANNKVYSEEQCILLPKMINAFLTDRNADRGKCPIGVNQDKSGRYMARCSNPLTGNRDYLGLFDDINKAHLAWRMRKSHLITKLIATQKNKRIINGLLNYKRMLDQFEIYKDGFIK